MSVLCDVILPEGQTRKYVKTVFGVVVSLVIIQPLVGLFSNGLAYGVVDGNEIAPQQQYIQSVASRQDQYALKTVTQLLEGKGIAVKSINLSALGDRLVLEFDVAYTAERNSVVKQVAAAYFPKAEVVCIWSES